MCEETKHAQSMIIEEENPAIDEARKIATSVAKYQEALGYEPDCSDLASEAYSNYAKFAKIEDIGTAYLLSTCNQYFAYDLKLLDDRLFLRETQSAEPKNLVYSLQKMFVLTTETPNQPSVFSKSQGIELFSSREQIAVRYLYSAKIVCLSGVHRRIFF